MILDYYSSNLESQKSDLPFIANAETDERGWWWWRKNGEGRE
jgi:hypothetical protein